MRYYAGIGSRDTPLYWCAKMAEEAKELAWKGFILRSGHADGADKAFEEGCDFHDPTLKEIWIPWKGFNDSVSINLPSPEAFEMAAAFHPAWSRCGRGARALHARNCHQILGRDLKTPVEFVVCWTKGGKLVGGTAQALRIA